jgi:hypothetical protein
MKKKKKKKKKSVFIFLLLLRKNALAYYNVAEGIWHLEIVDRSAAQRPVAVGPVPGACAASVSAAAAAARSVQVRV